MRKGILVLLLLSLGSLCRAQGLRTLGDMIYHVIEREYSKPTYYEFLGDSVNFFVEDNFPKDFPKEKAERNFKFKSFSHDSLRSKLSKTNRIRANTFSTDVKADTVLLSFGGYYISKEDRYLRPTRWIYESMMSGQHYYFVWAIESRSWVLRKKVSAGCMNRTVTLY